MNEEFEKWMSDWCARNPNPATVLQEQTVWAAAWQASRKQALEEAAAKCDEVVGLGTVFVAGLTAAQACAERIRALQQQ